MKPIAIIAVGIGALVGGAIGASLLGLVASPAAPTPAAASPETITEYVAAETDGSHILEIASLRTELDSLRDEVARLSSARESAVESVATPVAAVTATAPSENMILDVLQRKEEREEEERRVEREQREQDALDRRVERIAEKLSLSAADQTTLAQIYTEERAKQTEMWTMMREGTMDRETIRESMTEVRDWRTEQLTLSFGEDLAGQISEEGGGRGGFGDWGGGGRGGNNGGGRGGGRGGR